MQNTVTATVRQFLRLLNARPASGKLRRELEGHPNFPSLLAISDTLRAFNIPNAAYEVDLSELSGVEGPFIVPVSDSGGGFRIVRKVANEYFILENGEKEGERISIGDFEKSYGGNVLLVSPVPKIYNHQFYGERIKDALDLIRLPFVIVGLHLLLFYGLFFFSSYVSDFSATVLTITLSKYLGIIVSIFLLIQTIDASNPIVQRFCSGVHANCDAVLSSEAARFFWGRLSWSEIGFFYFSGTLLITLFNTHSIALMQTLSVLNILCLPYTFFSIYYQVRVIKQWCVLCCTVQVLLWVEFIPLISFLFRPYTPPGLKEWMTLIFGFLLPVIVWAYIKPYLLELQQANNDQKSLRRFLNDGELFDRVLKSQEPKTLLSEENTVVLGNPNANKIVTIVTSPYCPPCSKAHMLLDKWLSFNDDLKLQVVFFPTDSKGKEVARHIMTLATSRNNTYMANALNSWYHQRQKDFESWKRLFPSSGSPDMIDGILSAQEEWCRTGNIDHTPTILINGHWLQEPYRLEDIKFFI